ncbi:hypothetical protein NEF87_004609 [Candidatus Lokiarchaeum ossiferum]|uniref:Gelsolin-like domain-containing protein n=1 Tax=Candidatus Lokiarchaeum ossiferum TaxID=2951803 RepID=A0ABY6HXS0_9ARCH|nr:hypothetical protein NEF87_004609 [Candidatus Lokiarchaeum sp. B-35]
MNQGKSFYMMFDVVEGGIVEAIEFSKESLTPDRSIIIMDEENQTVWLWHGKRRALVPRRMALRQAQSIKGHGYQAGNAIVGRDLSKIIEIDDRKVGREPATTEDNDKLMALLNCQFTSIGNSVFTKLGEGEVAAPSKEVSPKTDAPPELKKVSAPAPTAVKPVDTKSDDQKKGAIIMAVLSEFKDLWISRKDDGILSLEQMDGKICSFKVENGEISFQTGSFFEIPKEKKDAILKIVDSL